MGNKQGKKFEKLAALDKQLKEDEEAREKKYDGLDKNEFEKALSEEGKKLAEKKDREENIPRLDMSIMNIQIDEIKLKEIAFDDDISVCYKGDFKDKKVYIVVFKWRIMKDDRKAYSIFEKTVKFLQNCEEHPGFFKYFGSYLKPPRIGYVVENSDSKQVTPEDLIGLSVPQKLSLLLEICDILKTMHSYEFYHGDLQWIHFFLSKEFKPQLLEVGANARFHRHLQKKDKNEDQMYTAPEITLSSEISEKSDIYSFGIMMYILMTGDWKPFGDDSKNIGLKVSLNPLLRPMIRENEVFETLTPVCEIMELCWNVEVDIRPTLDQIIDKIKETEKLVE